MSAKREHVRKRTTAEPKCLTASVLHFCHLAKRHNRHAHRTVLAPIPGICAVVVLLLVTTWARVTFAQELSEGVLPPSMRTGVAPPEHFLYGAFLRNEAGFEILARQREAQGLSGAALRAHFVKVFGVTLAEQTEIARIALRYDSAAAPLRDQKRLLVQAFQEHFFPGKQHFGGTPRPQLSPELQAVSAKIRQQILNSRDELHGALGNERFSHLESVLRARAAHDFRSLDGMNEGSK